MSHVSAAFKIISSLVWGVGTGVILYQMNTDGAQSGWSEFLMILGVLGILQSFSFVSFIMSSFHRGADEALNTEEEKIWVDRFGRVVHRETDAGSGCFVAIILWALGIFVTLLASALLSPVIFVVNLCRVSHHFASRKLAIILDLVIIGVTIFGVVWGFGVADRAIQARETKRQMENARRFRETAAERERVKTESEQQRKEQEELARQQQRAWERQIAEQEAEQQAEQARKRAEKEAKKAEQQAERERKRVEKEAKKAEQQAERERKRAEKEAKKAEQQAEQARKRAEKEAKKAEQKLQRELKRQRRK